MNLLDHASRLFDDKPWAAHLYVTDQCNLDCHYCNEYDNGKPHPEAAELIRWMEKLRELGVVRIGMQGGEPLMHPDIVEIVRAAKQLGFAPVSMATNGFLLTRRMLSDLEAAGLDTMNISVDRMTPIPSTRKSLKSVVKKLDWFADSKVRLNVSGVLFQDTLDEMNQVLQTCLDKGVSVHARVIHDDLVNDRKLRLSPSTEPLLAMVDYQARLKAGGERIHTTWNILDYQRAMLRGERQDWTCTAGYKYFFVSAEGKFWLCSQVRTERHIMEVTAAELRGYNTRKDCQDGCGVYCIVDTSLAVNDPVRYARTEARGRVGSELATLRRRLAGATAREQPIPPARHRVRIPVGPPAGTQPAATQPSAATIATPPVVAPAPPADDRVVLPRP
jgi:MoaA/NifB/PqqE/SkfB family radical SAM enzyme